MKDVILRWWVKDTQESGRWIEEEMSEYRAERIIEDRVFDRAYILEDDEKEGKQHLEDK